MGDTLRVTRNIKGITTRFPPSILGNLNIMKYPAQDKGKPMKGIIQFIRRVSLIQWEVSTNELRHSIGGDSPSMKKHNRNMGIWFPNIQEV